MKNQDISRGCNIFSYLRVLINVNNNKKIIQAIELFQSQNSELDWLNTLLARFRKFKFLCQNYEFAVNAVCPITEKGINRYQPVLLIFISKHRTTFMHLVAKFTEYRTVRVP